MLALDPLLDPLEDRLAAVALFAGTAGRALSRAAEAFTVTDNAIKIDKQTEDLTAGPPGSCSVFHPVPGGDRTEKPMSATLNLGENTAQAPGFLCPAKYRISGQYPTDFFVIYLTPPMGFVFRRSR